MSIATVPLPVERQFTARARPTSVLDAGLAVAVFAVAIALLSRHGLGSLQPGTGELDALSATLTAASTLPIAAWRRAPMAVFVVTSAASIVLAAAGYELGLAVGPTLALYLLAASREDAGPWRAATTGVVVGLLVAFLGATWVGLGGFPATELFHTSLAWAAAWFAGERTRLRREHLADVHERALRIATDAERDRRLAVAEERARIARDLHDSAGHAINVIAVRAGAARMRRGQDPTAPWDALAAIEDLARQTATEIDVIVGTLRDHGAGDGAVTTPLGLVSMQTLVAHHAAGGLNVTVDTVGTPRPLAAPVDLAAYRILQEALTNAARHGAGAAAVGVIYGARSLSLVVTNPLPADVAQLNGGGHGLIGMRERAALLGGCLDSGRVGGRFRLRVELPYAGPTR